MITLDDQVTNFVADFIGVKPERLALSTTLLGDLGVDGADGWELVDAFGKRFQVDVSTFRADRHFGPEGLPIWAPFVCLWRLTTCRFRKTKSPEQEDGLTPIRMADLIGAAKERRWLL
jgi:hypothetical protein